MMCPRCQEENPPETHLCRRAAPASFLTPSFALANQAHDLLLSYPEPERNKRLTRSWSEPARRRPRRL